MRSASIEALYRSAAAVVNLLEGKRVKTLDRPSRESLRPDELVRKVRHQAGGLEEKGLALLIERLIQRCLSLRTSLSASAFFKLSLSCALFALSFGEGG